MQPFIGLTQELGDLKHVRRSTRQQVVGVVGQGVQGSIEGLGPVGSRDLGHVQEPLGGILPGEALVILPPHGGGVLRERLL